MVVDDGSALEARQTSQMRTTVQGAKTLLRKQLQSNLALRKGIMRLLASKRVSILDKRDLLDICFVLMTPKLIPYYASYTTDRPVGCSAQK